VPPGEMDRPCPMPARNRRNPKTIAQWRYEQIEEALATPAHDVRGPLVRALCRPPVVWPNGRTKPISLATLYRWMKLFKSGGLAALRPPRRKDAGKKRAKLPAHVLRTAFSLLASDPEMSFTFLLALLRADPRLRLSERGIRLSRSTLQRRLAADAGYARLKRARKLARRRSRYVGRHLHDIWHLDAKGPITLRLTSGERVSFHVLTVLEDVSRAVLAAIVVLTPDLAAAVRVTRLAAHRWGLCDRVYADRASIFDTPAYRSGLAQLGIHRIYARSRNPEANGKIEAYHRALAGWFTRRLPRQQVIDLVHLQQLLDAFVEVLYQDHHHRGLAATPRQALGDKVSPRQVPSGRIDDAFLEERILKAHPKTGEVDLSQGTYLCPDSLRGQRLTFLLDPELRLPPLVLEPGTARHLPLERAAVRLEAPAAEAPPVRRWAEGPLQTLYDSWQGKVRPVAEPGFGLPEVFALLADAAGRPVPRSDAEAATIQHAYRCLGPLPRRATEEAFRGIRRALGRGRPVQAYLDALAQRVVAAAPTKPTPKRKRSP
jgi:putative transposase